MKTVQWLLDVPQASKIQGFYLSEHLGFTIFGPKKQGILPEFAKVDSSR
jgi:hypothetical protein